ncbi:MAG: protein translocase subunit SecD [Clostridia bacterium]|nr:protein translocase subunit SecD [Clostridia bacterium]
MKKKSIAILALAIIVALGINYIAFFGVSAGKVNYGGMFDPNKGIKKGIDLAGGSVITFEAEAENPTDEQMDIVEAIFSARLYNAGYSEARISRDETGKVTVEIPQETDTKKAADLLGSTAKLTFVDPEGNIVLDGAKDIKDAKHQYQKTSETSAPENIIELTITNEAVDRFAEATARVSQNTQGQNYIAIMLDDSPIASPEVKEEIRTTNPYISGGFTAEEAQKLANQIKSGALPFNLKLIQTETIGAELGSRALPSSLMAAGIGILVIMLFMIIMYRVPGLVADLALLFYVGIISLVLGLMRVNLSLSGIAGIILSIGMAVDANVIIFERIKEEMKLGKTIKASVDSGFKKAFGAILDSNVTTIITCVVLYFSGINTIKGFAVTLGLGVVVSMLTAIVITKFLLKQLVRFNIKNRKLFCKE